jgi:hypothetical protein
MDQGALRSAKARSVPSRLLVGSVVGIGSAVAAGYALRINYDYDGLYIPDSVINNIRRTGAPALTTKNDAHIAISLISISEDQIRVIIHGV